MGICRSTCSQSNDLEYYDSWRHQQAKLNRKARTEMLSRYQGGQRNTKLWMCDRGCCSIRWKLDYAEFQSYTKYAEISPYVVVQDKSGECHCVICDGLPESFLKSAHEFGARRGRTSSDRSSTENESCSSSPVKAIIK